MCLLNLRSGVRGQSVAQPVEEASKPDRGRVRFQREQMQ